MFPVRSFNTRMAQLTSMRRKQAQRSPEEEGDFMAFEQLVAEAAIKKEKEKDKEERKKKKHGHSHATEPAAEASTTTA